jgi:uncharacterized protein YjbJ (UPF0337 family)
LEVRPFGYGLKTTKEEARTVALEDKARNSAETARGKAKNVVGRATGNKDLESEGKAEQVVGHLKQAGEKVKDAVKSVVDDQK